MATDHGVASDEGITYQVLGAVGLIRIDRPARLGAFTWAMIDRWAEALVSARHDDSVRAVVLTGTGKGFCTGVDLDDLASVGEHPIDSKRMLTDRVHKVARAVEDLDKPLICAVNGLAIGAGMDMALMCDIRLAAESARFSEGYIRVGLVPGDGGAYFLPRLVGTAKALELLWTGDSISAQDACAMGIVNRVHPDDELLDEALALANRIAEQSPIAVSMIKRAVYQSLRSDLRTSLDLISSHLAVVQSTEDYAEAMSAFRDRRPPVFKGR
ncbi:enoyl-CoA hydratase-related protein [Streptosporangium sp. NPDC002544]|uniref:enoyl-CoA hydratase/isomerase family protein n=1 Tax=unclassified Streptosporangium TaxID=2632669 RepID=UPI00332965E0